MSNLVKVNNNRNASLWNRFTNFFLQVFGISSDEIQTVVIEPVDMRKEYVKSSTKKIRTLSNVLKCDEFVIGETVTIEQPQLLFNDILKIVNSVHSRIESDINIIPEKLEQFHMYYTDNLITLLAQLKNMREDIREVHINSEPYVAKAISYREALINQALKNNDAVINERYGDVIGKRMIKAEREAFLATLDRRIFYIKNSKDVERCPIFYSMGHLYKVFIGGENNEYVTKKLVINEGFNIRIEDAKYNNDDNFANIILTKQKICKVEFFSLTQEQYDLLVEFKIKIGEYYTNMDGKKEKIKLEIDNLKSILNTDMLDLG